MFREQNRMTDLLVKQMLIYHQELVVMYQTTSKVVKILDEELLGLPHEQFVPHMS